MTYDVITAARRRTRRRASVAALVVAALAALTILVVSTLSRPGGSAPQSGGGAATADSVNDLGSRVQMPSDLRWQPVAGISVPLSAQAGPRDSSGGRARGFSQDGAGAVLAAVHLVVRVAPQVGPAVFDVTLREQVVGPDAEALRSRVGQDYDDLRANAGAAYGKPVGQLEATLRGYRLDSYTPQEATVRILTEVPGGANQPLLAASSVRLRWTGADWALVAPPGGDFNTSVSAVDDADGFHPLLPR